jgi:outer membrane lipoprotein-sorting protein
LDKVAQLRSVNYLLDLLKIPLNFTALQNLIVGNALYLDSNIVSYKNEESAISLVSIGDLFKHFLTIGKNDYHLLHSKLDDVDNSRARTCDITYGDYVSKNGVNFSTFRKITVSEKSKLDIELHFKQFDFNEQLNFPFSVPKNYKLQ